MNDADFLAVSLTCAYEVANLFIDSRFFFPQAFIFDKACYFRVIMKGKNRKLLSHLNDLGLYTEKEFFRIHDYEKLRSDRNGMEFSYITINVDTNAIRPRFVKRLIMGILGQLRSIDHIGMCGTDRIGILLPGTEKSGALGFLKNIDHLLSEFSGISVDDIITYPEPQALMTAVSASVASASVVESSDTSEAEEVAIIPFEISK